MLACCYFYTGFTAPGSLSEYKLQKNFRFVIRSNLRCLIYKVQCFSLFAFQRSSLVIISSHQRFVKNFFHFFLTHFEYLLSDSLFILSSPSSFVKNFLKFLFAVLSEIYNSMCLTSQLSYNTTSLIQCQRKIRHLFKDAIWRFFFQIV